MQKKQKNALIRLFRESKESWVGWLILLVLSFLSGWFGTLIARYTGRLVDVGIAGSYGEVPSLGILLLVVLLCSCVRTSLHNFINAKTTEAMFFKVRRRMYEALVQGKVSYIEENLQTGDVVSRLSNDVGTLSETIAGQLTWYIRVTFEAAVSLWVCFGVSWELSLVYLVMLPASFLLMNALSKNLRGQQKKAAVYTGSAASVVSEAIGGIATVRVFGMEGRMREKLSSQLSYAQDKEMEMQKTESLITGVRYVIQVLQLAVLFGVAIWLVVNGRLSPGDAIAFITVCASIRTALELSDRMISSYNRMIALAERVYEVLDIPLPKKGSSLPDDSAENTLLFHNVTFAYEADRSILNGVELCIPKGQRIGVVGPSGCGKSTLIKLICRFYSVTGGSLLAFGQKIDEVKQEELFRRIALVGQEPYLFDGTIFDNVADGRPGATQQEVERVLRRVQLWEHVSSLKDGVFTRVGEKGGQLSGGQAQRVSIARALLKDADLILLDEPTSALDGKTEMELIGAFEELLRGKTALIVTHRYMILENADYIYCLNSRGMVEEEGSPEQLLQRQGYYATMRALV